MKRPPFAFPDTQPLNEYSEHGMTLRDYFAGQAVVGIIARSPLGRLPSDEDIARHAYHIASVMLETRKELDA